MSEFDQIYAKFEARFRGSREPIIERLKIYAPFLSDLEGRLPQPLHAIDCGCGRGEWLQVLTDRGWKAFGVDLNESMLSEARELGLRVERRDLFEQLKELDPTSTALVSAFHVVEHIPQEGIVDLLRQAKRVLQPGGLLILETPNPENLAVGTSTFYIDPTHLRPLPPPLLQFFVEQAGFGGCHIVRLNGEDKKEEATTLEQVIEPMFTRAYDYAIVAVSDGDAATLTALADAALQVSQRHPIDLAALHALSRDLKQSDSDIQRLKEGVHKLGEAGGRIEIGVAERLESVDQQLAALRASLFVQGERLREMAAALSSIRQTVAEVQSSRTWRMTRPLRMSAVAARRIWALIQERGSRAVVDTVDHVLPKTNHFVSPHNLEAQIQSLGTKWPRAGRFVLNRMRSVGMIAPSAANVIEGAGGEGLPSIDQMLSRLPPRSRAMYRELQEGLAGEPYLETTHASPD